MLKQPVSRQLNARFAKQNNGKGLRTQNQGNEKNAMFACDEALNNLSDEQLLQKLEKI